MSIITTPLSPQFPGQKSFCNKAKVIIDTDLQSYTLQSYSTIVASVQNGRVKNEKNLNFLLESSDWKIDPIHSEQVIYLHDTTSSYDVLNDELDAKGSGYSQCECCRTIYLSVDEPAEVKEGGTSICASCWSEEE